jgi:hypothetical protein
MRSQRGSRHDFNKSRRYHQHKQLTNGWRHCRTICMLPPDGLMRRKSLTTENQMLVTEQYAKANMWCPMVRYRFRARLVSFNRVNLGPRYRLVNAAFRTFFPRLHWLLRAKYFRCWGSGCMMWRWEGGNSQRGYCGLAGTPIDIGLPDEKP